MVACRLHLAKPRQGTDRDQSHSAKEAEGDWEGRQLSSSGTEHQVPCTLSRGVGVWVVVGSQPERQQGEAGPLLKVIFGPCEIMEVGLQKKKERKKMWPADSQ